MLFRSYAETDTVAPTQVFGVQGIPEVDTPPDDITYRTLESDVQIINERSIRNALTCDMALGCSTNTVLHLSLIHICPGHIVRRLYTEGEGCPSLICVEQDYTGKAKEIARCV